MSVLNTLEIIKRNGSTVAFDQTRIIKAVQNAYSAAKVSTEEGRYDEVIDSILAKIGAQFSEHSPAY